LPEKHAKKYDDKDAKDKAPPLGTEGVIVLGRRPIGIAHVETYFDARQQAQSHSGLLKIS
jgi:hypothetical protein